MRQLQEIALLAVEENQGIIDCKGTETRQFFFSYECNSKKINELFACTLNGITASVSCVFYDSRYKY